jgi:hypothetical protein
MRSIFSILLMTLLLPLVSIAQGIIQMTESSLLYKNYDNIVRIGFQDKRNDFILNVEGAAWRKSADGVYVINPHDDANLVSLIFIDKKGDTLAKQLFRCHQIPEPQVNWGGVTIEDIYSFNNDPFISVELPDDALKNRRYQVFDWQITLNDINYSGQGNILSENQ